MSLDPGALETNRAGMISPGRRSKLRARATGALLGFVGTAVFALIAWWIALTGGHVQLAVAAVIATVVAPVALWTFDRIRSDLRSGRVVRVTGIAVVIAEADDESPYRVSLNGRRLRVPRSAGGILNQPGQVTAYYTAWSAMLVNLAPAED